ncbi:MAG: helix-turn-helix domain-containing protein [Ignavibacteriales bacterium]|nr:helix-turn-helix domain-containing protein [Ignavibacteriales bacterium]
MLNNPTQELQELLKFYQQQNEKPLNLIEASKYLDLSKSYLYKLTHEKKIAFSKPTGKKLYFQKSDLIEFMKRNRKKTEFEIEQGAINLVKLGGNNAYKE